MRPLIHLVAVHLSLVATARPLPDGSARIFDTSRPGEALYTYTLQRTVDGERVQWNARFLDSKAGEVAVETTRTESGRLVSYHLKQPMQDEEAEMRATPEQVHFRYRRGDKWQEAKEKNSPETIAPPQIVDWAQRHWDKIAKGETVFVRLAVPDRLETFGFRYRKQASNETGRMLVEFTPSSFLIRQFAPSVELLFDEKSRKLLRLRGPSFLKKMEKGAWVPLSAEFRFD